LSSFFASTSLFQCFLSFANDIFGAFEEHMLFGIGFGRGRCKEYFRFIFCEASSTQRIHQLWVWRIVGIGATNVTTVAVGMSVGITGATVVEALVGA
jgi:hypothetical protein